MIDCSPCSPRISATLMKSRIMSDCLVPGVHVLTAQTTSLTAETDTHLHMFGKTSRCKLKDDVHYVPELGVQYSCSQESVLRVITRKKRLSLNIGQGRASFVSKICHWSVMSVNH